MALLTQCLLLWQDIASSSLPGSFPGVGGAIPPPATSLILSADNSSLFLIIESEVSFMTEKQKIFADEYLIDLNGTRAYKAAYPNIKSDNAAAVRANKLLKKKEIWDYIQQRLDEIASKRVAKQQEVMEYLTSVMRGASTSSVLAMCGDGMQEVIEKPPDEKESLRAAELLGRRYGMWTEKVDVTSNGKTMIVDDIDG